MIIQSMNRRGPETVFVICKSLSGSAEAILEGTVVEWVLSGSPALGIDVTDDTINANLVAGVVPVGGRIEYGGFGLIQIYGYHPRVKADSSGVVYAPLVIAGAYPVNVIQGAATVASKVGVAIGARETVAYCITVFIRLM